MDCVCHFVRKNLMFVSQSSRQTTDGDSVKCNKSLPADFSKPPSHGVVIAAFRLIKDNI